MTKAMNAENLSHFVSEWLVERRLQRVVSEMRNIHIEALNAEMEAIRQTGFGDALPSPGALTS